LAAYTELCRIVGHLGIFDASHRTKEVPHYNHDELARIFKWARDEIYRLMKVSKLEYEKRDFVGTEHGMEVSINEKWVEAAWDWYVGVNGQQMDEREIRELLRPGNLDWKMGSSQQVDTIFRFRIPGVGLIDLPQPPRALPSRQGWVYYEVRKDPDGQAWRDVFMTKTLAMRFKKELIRNLNNLKGQKKLEVFAHGKHSVLEFALFAVPKQ
jgi:type VI secretion system protein ImpJ